MSRALTIGELRELAKWLRDARKAATMETMSIGSIYAGQHADGMPCAHNGADITERNVTEFVRERTRLYRDSWVIGPLDIALEILDRMDAPQ